MDLDGADILSTLHSLYSMTFTALGKCKSKVDTSVSYLVFLCRSISCHPEIFEFCCQESFKSEFFVSVVGKAAVTSVLGMASNLECLLPFVEHAGKNVMNTPLTVRVYCFAFILTFSSYVTLEKLCSDSKDAKSKKSVSSRYASVLILLTIQGMRNFQTISNVSNIY